METLVLTSQQKIAISRTISEIRLYFAKAKGEVVARAIPTYIKEENGMFLPVYSEETQKLLKKYDDDCSIAINDVLKSYGIKLENGEFFAIEEGKICQKD